MADETRKPDNSKNVQVSGIIETKFTPEFLKDIKTGQDQEHTRETNRFKVEIATLFIVLTYTTVALWQGCSSQKAANAAKSAADTADQTLKHIVANDKATSDAALATFKEEERAYISASYAQMSNPSICQAPGSPEIRVCADIHTVNSGKTPAIGIRLHRYATYGKNAESIIKALKIPPHGLANGALLGNIGDKWGTAPTDPVDRETAKRLVDGSDVLYIYGVVQYFDIFGDYHETGFCYSRVPESTAFIGCEYGNWFDQRPAYTGGK